MRAGQLKHRITVEQVTESESAIGSTIEDWTPFLTNIHSSYEPQSGSESFKEDQEQGFMVAKFRIRYRAGITTKMRVNFKGQYGDIIAAPDYLGLGKEIHIMAKFKA